MNDHLHTPRSPANEDERGDSRPDSQSPAKTIEGFSIAEKFIAGNSDCRGKTFWVIEMTPHLNEVLREKCYADN